MCKKILGVLLAGIMLCTACLAADFSDMPEESYWSYEALSSAVADGLLNGSDGKIYPRNNLTRAEMATILVRAYKLADKADISEYTDVAPDAWYYEYMQKACAKGLFKGDDSKKLNPVNNITRQEVFVVLSRALNLTGGKAEVLDAFSDKDLIASWALDATAAMIESGYIKGSGDKLNPVNNITREEFAQIMLNLKKAGLFEEKKEETKTEDKTEEKKEEASTGGSTGGTTGGGGSSKPSKPSKPSTDDDDKPVINPIPGIDENVDMSDD
ncbi:MAG: S-layer homology domain-containing protein [Clostridia bacterium]|nr:S-layer homology domain-containing protein [Clostridia bacterium]